MTDQTQRAPLCCRLGQLRPDVPRFVQAVFMLLDVRKIKINKRLRGLNDGWESCGKREGAVPARAWGWTLPGSPYHRL
jgi:hypothetical protein